MPFPIRRQLKDGTPWVFDNGEIFARQQKAGSNRLIGFLRAARASSFQACGTNLPEKLRMACMDLRNQQARRNGRCSPQIKYTQMEHMCCGQWMTQNKFATHAHIPIYLYLYIERKRFPAIT
jgi:hypothetical protein